MRLAATAYGICSAIPSIDKKRKQMNQDKNLKVASEFGDCNEWSKGNGR
jgi:hypothetical protein